MKGTPRYAPFAHHSAATGFSEQYINENAKNHKQVKNPNTDKETLREVIRSRKMTINNSSGMATARTRVGRA